MNIIDSIKFEKGFSTSEEIFEIIEQPGDTCPILDKILKHLDHTEREIANSGKYNEYDLSKFENELNLISIYVEESRENVEKIRNWGQEWKDLAKKYAEKYGEL